MNGTSYYTGEEFRNAKALKAHGQTNFGWVMDLQIFTQRDVTVVISEVCKRCDDANVANVSPGARAALYFFFYLLLCAIIIYCHLSQDIKNPLYLFYT